MWGELTHCHHDLPRIEARGNKSAPIISLLYGHGLIMCTGDLSALPLCEAQAGVAVWHEERCAANLKTGRPLAPGGQQQPAAITNSARRHQLRLRHSSLSNASPQYPRCLRGFSQRGLLRDFENLRVDRTPSAVPHDRRELASPKTHLFGLREVRRDHHAALATSFVLTLSLAAARRRRRFD